MIIILLMVIARLITGVRLDDWNENILKDGAALAFLEILLEIDLVVLYIDGR